MNNLDKYIEKKKKELQKKNITEELEIIRYIYLDLGNRFSFNEKFLPFGSSKSKQNLYKYHSRNIADLNLCMDTNKVICKSLSYILEYVLKSFDVDIKTVVEKIEHIACPHVYNYIKLKDGRKFFVDLQEDINNIQTHSFVSNFGLVSPTTWDLVITRQEQEALDRKLGFIDKNNGYSDEYLDLLHLMVDGMEDFREKANFILENIDIVPTTKMGYIDRQWHHRKILENFFDSKEFDYQGNSGKIRMYDCYKDINGKRRYYNFVLVLDKGEVDVYIYNKKDSCYKKMAVKNCVNCLANGIMVHNAKMPYIKQKSL